WMGSGARSGNDGAVSASACTCGRRSAPAATRSSAPLDRPAPRAAIARRRSVVVEREPDRRPRGVRPLDAMPAGGGNGELGCGPHLHHVVAVGKTQPGAAREQDDPFLAFLVVPLARGSRMTEGDDALEPKRVRLEQRFDKLVG